MGPMTNAELLAMLMQVTEMVGTLARASQLLCDRVGEVEAKMESFSAIQRYKKPPLLTYDPPLAP